jgi:hypothetical protein
MRRTGFEQLLLLPLLLPLPLLLVLPPTMATQPG